MNLKYSILCIFFGLGASFGELKKNFILKDEPIDVVITARNRGRTEYCIDSIKTYVENVRNIYVISPKKFTDKAIWVDENIFPFTDLQVATHIFNDEQRAQTYIGKGRRRIGWYLQQLLKLYAPLVIPSISSNVLIVDSDVIFLAPISFMNDKNEPLFCEGRQYHDPYFRHGRRLLPGFERVVNRVSGIAHHILMQKDVIENLFSLIESLHKKPAWEAICDCVELQPNGELHSTGLSEYEIYFNYFLAHSGQGHIRKLKWANVSKNHDVWQNGLSYEELKQFEQDGYHFISRH